MSCTNALPIKKSFQVMMKLSVSGKQATDSANSLFSPPPCLQVFDVQSQEKLSSFTIAYELDSLGNGRNPVEVYTFGTKFGKTFILLSLLS